LAAAAQRRAPVREYDLEAQVSQAIAEHTEAMRKLAGDPRNTAAMAIAHLAGAHLDEVRVALADYCVTNAAIELAVERGRELERAELTSRRRTRPEAGQLRPVLG
jgi:hypothetical protein